MSVSMMAMDISMKQKIDHMESHMIEKQIMRVLMLYVDLPQMELRSP